VRQVDPGRGRDRPLRDPLQRPLQATTRVRPRRRGEGGERGWGEGGARTLGRLGPGNRGFPLRGAVGGTVLGVTGSTAAGLAVGVGRQDLLHVRAQGLLFLRVEQPVLVDVQLLEDALRRHVGWELHVLEQLGHLGGELLHGQRPAARRPALRMGRRSPAKGET